MVRADRWAAQFEHRFLTPTDTFRRFHLRHTQTLWLFVCSICQFTGMPANHPQSCRHTFRHVIVFLCQAKIRSDEQRELHTVQVQYSTINYYRLYGWVWLDHTACFGASSERSHKHVHIHVQHDSFGGSNHRTCSQTLVWDVLFTASVWNIFKLIGQQVCYHVCTVYSIWTMFWASCGWGLCKLPNYPNVLACSKS